MQPAKINYKIYQGGTFEEVYRWESQTKVYVPIQDIQKSAPCVITTTEPHSIPQGWRVRVTGAGGMKEINNTTADSYYLATGITENTVEFNQVNSLGYTTYTQGGVLEYNQPVPLTWQNARMQIRETVDSPDVILSIDAGNIGTSIAIVNETDFTITVIIPATVTKDFNFTTAVYSLELYDVFGVVTPFLSGNLTLVPEVIR